MSSDTTSPPETPARPTGRPRGLLVGFVVIALAIVGLAVGLVLAGGSDDSTSVAAITRHVVIPEGTADDIAKGKNIKLIPDVLKVNQGDRLVITNHDVVTHALGPYVVRAGEELEIHYTQVGVFPGPCTFVSKGRTVIVVS